MKEFFRKTLALALALTLVFTLAACARKVADGGELPTPTAGGEEEPTPTPSVTPVGLPDLATLGVDFLPDNAVDVAQEVLGFPGSTVLYTVNGVGVTAEEYLYWLGYMASYYEMMYYTYYGEDFLNLDEVVAEDGTTLDQQLKEIAYQNSMILALIPELAAQYNVSLSDDDMEGLIQQREDGIESAGGADYYAYQLQGMGINDATAFRMDEISTLLGKVEEAYTAGLTEQEVMDFAQEKGYLRAKHILLLTTDMNTGAPYDDATVAQQKAKAEDVLAQLQADPSKFDELMNQYSEDTGLATNPDGYFFGRGEMVESFENGTLALNIGEISGLIESEYGYHIIQRLSPDCEEAREQMFDTMMQERADNAAVEKTAQYDSFTTKDYYEGILTFQKSLPYPGEEDMSNATLEPQPTDN